MLKQNEIDEFNKSVILRTEFIVDNLRFFITIVILIFDVLNQTYEEVPKLYIGELGTTLLLIMSTNFQKFEQYKLYYIVLSVLFYIFKFSFFEFNTLWILTLGILIFGNLDFKKKSDEKLNQF